MDDQRTNRESGGTRLKDLVHQLRKRQIDLNAYDGGLFNAAFDIVTAEAAMMGLADQALNSKTPTPGQLKSLDYRLLDGNQLILLDGSRCDLSAAPSLAEHARLIVQLQVECEKIFHPTT